MSLQYFGIWIIVGCMNRPEAKKQAPPNYCVEYKGQPLRLGNKWADICRNIELQVSEPRVAASLKMCLFDKLKKELHLSPTELEQVLQAYADTL